MPTATPAKSKMIRLLEYTSNRGGKLRVDRENNVVHGVKILGLESRNGRSYTPEAVRSAVGLYEGAKVNIDHPERGGAGQRGYRDRFGVLKNVVAESNGLRGDLHYNPKHVLAEQFLWDAEHTPENVGLSHNAEARATRRDGKQTVEQITRVHSVDIVADPATTRSLYEQDETMDPMVDAGSGDMTLDMFVEKAKEIFSGDGEAADKAKRIGTLAKTLLKVKDDIESAASGDSGADASASSDGGEAAAAESLGADPAKQLKALREELDQFKAKEALAAKRKAVDAKISAAKIPAPLVTEAFIESLLSTDDAGQKRLIEDRQAIAKASRLGAYSPPSSRASEWVQESQAPVAKDGKEFASLLRV